MELQLWRLALLLAAAGVSTQDKLPTGGCLTDGGETVPEGSLVPQPDPCHVCHCHRGLLQCFWKSCAPPPRLCDVMQLEDRCNPSLYVCPIPASIADAPIHTSSSQVTETRQPAPEPETPPPQVIAPTRGRGRSRSRARTSQVRTSRLRSQNSATASAAASKPTGRAADRRRYQFPTRPTTAPSQSAQAVTSTQVRARQVVTQTEVTEPQVDAQAGARSQFRSRRPARRRVQPRPGMKIRLGPPVLPLIEPVDNFLPPPEDLGTSDDSAVAASVLSGSTYFNEELSVPHNFTMPQGRGDVPVRSPQELLSEARERKPFRFGPSPPQESSEEEDSEVAETSDAEVVAETPATEAPTAAPTPATPAAAGRGFRRTGRQRGSRRLLTPDTAATQPRTVSRRPVSPPQELPSRRSRLPSRRRPAAAQRTVDSTAAPATTAAPTTAAAAPVAEAAEAPAVAEARPAPTPSRRGHARARGRLQHVNPLMTFDYDLEDEDINPSDFMFPEFGRRLRRSLQEHEVFDADTVRKLEKQWSARQRRRRSLLPGDDNHVHSHSHHETKSCSILGVKYELGEVIGVASDNCLECRCAAQAMFCSPKCCFFALEERVLREGRQSDSDAGPPRPHPLHAYITDE